ncbi:hypothetical protein SLEP1_g14444 [Rubroshorea leprosula]|uniref:PB1 domain-containing protein n=1 Tax=Rubroshorea leprosula TaxID=152421 RepID=A0AAV5IRZ0_9ROSI|nr:hypothetical protein SLEP1_g14444 [Rubroshorea leprosula]
MFGLYSGGLEPLRRWGNCWKIENSIGSSPRSTLRPPKPPFPTALGATTVRGAPISGLGTCLPARPVTKKAAYSTGGSSKDNVNLNKQGHKEQSSSSTSLSIHGQAPKVAICWKPLKLVYDHGIRLAQMPVNCSFRVLREIVSKCFPSSKSIFTKYQDNDGDLVTITCITELRLVESTADGVISEEPGTNKDEEKALEMIMGDESGCPSSNGELVFEAIDIEIDKTHKESPKEKRETSKDPESKEVEMDDGLSHLLSFSAPMRWLLWQFSIGELFTCAARKRIPLDELAKKEVVVAKLQVAYDWVNEKYSLARAKYEKALMIKPDFYEEEKMKVATEMWEKLEEQRAKELKDPNASKREELLKRRKKTRSGKHTSTSGTKGEPSQGQAELSPEETTKQAVVMRSQIHLFWGNMLFERSQVECKLGMVGWKKNLDAAIERVKLVGASKADISAVLINHCSRVDAVEGDEKKVNGEAELGNEGVKGLTKLVCETDSTIVAPALQKPESARREISPIIINAVCLSKRFESIQFRAISQQAKETANWVATSTRKGLSFGDWVQAPTSSLAYMLACDLNPFHVQNNTHYSAFSVPPAVTSA